MCIDEEESGPRHIQKLSGGFGIQNLVSADRFGIGIREQRKINLPAICERFQYRLRVIADAGEFDALLLESCLRVLELDQLPFAVRSPVRRAKEKQDGSVRALQSFQRLLGSKLIPKGNGWRLLSGRNPD